MTETLLDRLVVHLDEVSDRPLPAAVDAKAKSCVLHAIGCAYGGRELEWSRTATTLAHESAVGGTSLVWLLGEDRPLLSAVYANSAASQATLAEDVHAESATHPGAVVVPAAIAVAERVGASGPALLAAVVAGYEAVAQVGRLALTPAFQQRGFRPTGVVGPLGAAAASARLLGLSPRGVRDALALAVNGAGGLVEWNFAGTMEAGFQTAAASRNGVEAALLAAQGSAGAATILDGPAGLLNAYSGGVADPGAAWPQRDALEIERTEMKPYGHCVFGQEAIEVTRRLVQAHGLRAADVRRAELSSYAHVKTYPGLDNPGPFKGPGECVASAQFAVAAVLLDGDFVAGRYGDWDSPELLDAASRIAIAIDPEAERRYPEAKVSTLRVERTDGSVVKERVDDLRLPTAADVEARFRRHALPVLGAAATDDAVAAVSRLDRLDDLEELLAALRTAAGAGDARA